MSELKESMNVLGLMSGSSLDGVDVAVLRFTSKEGSDRPAWEWISIHCFPYPGELKERLEGAEKASLSDYFQLESELSVFFGRLIKKTTRNLDAGDRPHLAAVHGHTLFHRPSLGFSVQMGNGGIIATQSGLPVISDFRNSAVAAGYQGAPMVPILDKLLSGDYTFFLNLGGIANISVMTDELKMGWDVCGCNQLLNFLAQKKGLPFDRDGKLAAKGKLIPTLLEEFNRVPFLKKSPPKSLSNQEVQTFFIGALKNHQGPVEDQLYTFCVHIGECIAEAIKTHLSSLSVPTPTKMLVTGGGAHHPVLLKSIVESCRPLGVEPTVPDQRMIDYKESLLMAYMGWLRYRQNANFLPEDGIGLPKIVGGGLYLPPE